MDNTKLLNALSKQYNEKYYTAKELEYSPEAGVFLTPFEYKQFIEYKEELAIQGGSQFVKALPLPSFNNKCLYVSLGKDITSLIESYSLIGGESFDVADRFSSEFTTSRIYSEIEGSLNVESVPTTRRRLKELLEENAPVKDRNDIIIKNMKSGIDFVNELPEFNKENLFRLYSILSKDCLDEDDKLRPGEYYRYDEVEISHYHGCPYQEINSSMDALFRYVNEVLKNKDYQSLLLLPHICHYYLIYIHPYFDYNGRTARMVSYWVYLLSGLNVFPPIVSEAINQTKNKYYKAIELSRDSHDDLTYFLKYILSLSIDYVICYQNLLHYDQVAKNKGGVLTATELNYLKRILISYEGVFHYVDFLRIINATMSKQGALKILNKFVEYGILIEAPSSSKTKLFDINKNETLYMMKNFGYKQK